MHRFLTLLVVVAFIASTCSSEKDEAVSSTTTTCTTGTTSVATDGDGAAPSSLMVQNAASATLEASGDGYTSTLEGIDPDTVWFNEQPNRAAGSSPTGDVADALFNTERSDGPPNAALVWRSDSNDNTVALELSTGEYDAAKQTPTYQTKILEQKSGQLAEFGPNVDVPDGPVSPAPVGETGNGRLHEDRGRGPDVRDRSTW